MLSIPIARFPLGRVAALALGAAALLATAGCDRSQPGPKPISGDAGAFSGNAAAHVGAGVGAPTPAPRD